MDKKKVLYVINPRSGMGRKGEIARAIKTNTDRTKVEFDIVRTTHHGHALEIATQHRDKVDAIVAVGGDGTVNQVGSGIIGSQTALGIIPCGSGNGLARELEIPLRIVSAVNVVNEMNVRKIDTLSVGGHTSLNVAGVGFDAYISHLFATKRVRGPLQYMNLIAKEFPNYKPQEYVIEINGGLYRRTAFLISFANSSQWGNNIHIAPNAMMDDGLMDICMISEFPNIAIPSLLISLLSQNIDLNQYDEMIRTNHLTLRNEEPIMGHADGEPIMLPPNAEIKVLHHSLNVLTPSNNILEQLRLNAIRLREQIENRVQKPIAEIRQKLKEIQPGDKK